jgi:GT2 family glycosyltransferase
VCGEEKMKKYPSVAIILVNWNGTKDTIECISSLSNLNYDNYDIIVVDNGSNDNAIASINNAYQNVEVIANSINVGYTGGNNIGIRYAIEAGYDYVWLLNNDTIVCNDSLSNLICIAMSYDNVGLLSPIIYYHKNRSLIQFSGSYVDWNRYEVIHVNNVNNWEHECCGKDVALWGTALLINTNVITKIGLLQEDYFAYWEDTEYSIRTLRAGYKNIICPESIIYHKTILPQLGFIDRKPYYYYYMVRNKFFFGKKYMPCTALILDMKYLAYVLDMYSKCTRAGAMESAAASLAGAWAAFNGKTGKWDNSLDVPVYFKKSFEITANHTFFWRNLLLFNFKAIFYAVSKLKLY